MTAYLTCEECGGDVPFYYAWRWHPTIVMHPGCAEIRWDEEGAGAIGPILRQSLAEAWQNTNSEWVVEYIDRRKQLFDYIQQIKEDDPKLAKSAIDILTNKNS